MKRLTAFVLGMALLPLLVILLAIVSSAAHAQPKCLPRMDTQTHIATEMWPHISSNGACVEWRCIRRDKGTFQENTYCGLPSELSKVGGRVQTIMKAADPLKSLQDAPKRFTILPLLDPRFHELRQELK